MRVLGSDGLSKKNEGVTGMCDVIQNIFIGIVSGILATLITNVITQYFGELRTIEKIQRHINEYTNKLEKYKNSKSQTVFEETNVKAYIEMNNLLDAVYDDVNDQTASLIFLKKKSDEIMLEFANIYKKIHDEKKFNMLYCIKQLGDLRDRL